jgi:hypothetical protein
MHPLLLRVYKSELHAVPLLLLLLLHDIYITLLPKCVALSG